MMIDNEKVLIKMDRAADRAEKKNYKCQNCGSDHFKEMNGWVECKYCKFICKSDTYEKQTVKKEESREYHVIKGPHIICSTYGVKGFSVPLGKYAIARLGMSQENKLDMIAALPILFDDMQQADKLAKAMRIKKEEKTEAPKALCDETFEPQNIELITNKEEVFDYGIIELTEEDLVQEVNNSWDRPRIVLFSCGDCAVHKTVNTKYDKNWKIKEPCQRCGKLIKAELVG